LNVEESQKDMPPPKRRRGQPRKSSSVTPSQSDMSSQSQPSPRNTSIDLDTSMRMADDRIVPGVECMLDLQEVMEESVIPPAVESADAIGSEVPATVTAMIPVESSVHDSMENAATNPGAMDIDVVAQKTVGGITEGSRSAPKMDAETTLVDSMRPVARSSQELAQIEQEVGVQSSEELGQRGHPLADAEVQTEAEEASTAKSIRERLQSLIGDLGKAVLTRQEATAFEDMFMDAKEQLYGAARRGRALFSS